MNGMGGVWRFFLFGTTNFFTLLYTFGARVERAASTMRLRLVIAAGTHIPMMLAMGGISGDSEGGGILGRCTVVIITHLFISDNTPAANVPCAAVHRQARPLSL